MNIITLVNENSIAETTKTTHETIQCVCKSRFTIVKVELPSDKVNSRFTIVKLPSNKVDSKFPMVKPPSNKVNSRFIEVCSEKKDDKDYFNLDIIYDKKIKSIHEALTIIQDSSKYLYFNRAI